jgi:NTE family protein
MQEWSNRMPFEDDTKRQDGIALACSGGGFRATLFHVGTLLRLNEFGLLGKIARYSSVSGGSITCGVLAHAWQRLEFDAAGVATNFTELVATPLEDFCSTGIDVSVIGRGVLNPFKSASDYLIEAYRDKLGLDVSLQTLPDTPRFVFNSTNLASGVSFRFSKPYMGDYRIGLYHNPSIDLATAVAASSAFPPFLSPLVIKVDDPNKFIKVTGADLYDDVSYRSKLYLTDGGVYDNMGLETVWNRYSIVLVSDAGAPWASDPIIAMTGSRPRCASPISPSNRIVPCASEPCSTASRRPRGPEPTGASAPTSPTTSAPEFSTPTPCPASASPKSERAWTSSSRRSRAS